MKATLLLNALFSSTALAGVIQSRQDLSGGTFKFAQFCTGSGTATSNPTDPQAKQFMTYHNVHRTLHGVCSLVWDPELAKQAQAAADTCNFQHQMTGDNGQNIAEHSASGNLAAGSTAMWYGEGSVTNYKGSNENMNQGHYTQMLWKGSHALGCGVKECGGNTLVFCDYSPAGNVMGEFAQNVGDRVANARPVCAEQQFMSQYGQDGSGGAKGTCISDKELGLPATSGAVGQMKNSGSSGNQQEQQTQQTGDQGVSSILQWIQGGGR